jgi:chorismate lyase/3-hydroxybenzoate synthase
MYNPSRSAERSAQAGGPFSVEYLDAAQRGEILADDSVFAIIEFGDVHGSEQPDPRVFSIALPETDGAPTRTLEVWRSRQPITHCRIDDITVACNEDMLFARLLLDEAKYDDLDAATFDAYRRIQRLLRHLDYPHLLRTWNYFPGINDPQHGMERYRSFSLGRYRALAEIGPDFETTLPAACAIGTRTPGLLIYWLAAKEPGEQI